ncbi:undecaprenyl-diphosphate phosphatase [uncultured Clostridium sp.]|uniref:undecaprenyl-diphosphate phosphatase n=1 Tax=uncultured Clostridium sp. TaxID=59620 RepID=UPI0025E356AC|nr:undecaprenyl-diphosphate phosphatase [uncultured Clostridium sp.]
MALDFLFILKAIIIAIVEGLTEFIPVSSTGHMIIASSIIGFNNPKEFVDMFEVVIQLGAIMAVVFLYWKKIKDSVIEFFAYIFSKGKKGKTGFDFGINVIVGSIPMLIFGLVFYSNIKKLFNIKAVAVGLIVGGCLLIIIENKFRRKKNAVRNVDNITPLQSLKIGCFQVLAAWPGMSRSASTIMGGWVAGLSTPIAAEFSFFLAIPAMIGSSGLDLLKFDYTQMTMTLWVTLIIGFIVAFIVSIVVMEKFVAYLKKRPMRVFAVYRIGVGIIFVILMFLGVNLSM